VGELGEGGGGGRKRGSSICMDAKGFLVMPGHSQDATMIDNTMDDSMSNT
jgi:hypothetical protein